MHGYQAAYGAPQQAYAQHAAAAAYPGYAAAQSQAAPAAYPGYAGYAAAGGHPAYGQAAAAQQQYAQHAQQAQQAQHAQQAQAAQAQPAQQTQRPQHLSCSGCKHETVAQIVRGDFTLASENHGKPVYKKNGQWNGLDVMIYFWDERDGPNFSGWWFGPKVGGDQVWAYHPDKELVPPPSGWKVPYDGPVDNTFILTPQAGAAQPQHAQHAQHAAAQQPQAHPAHAAAYAGYGQGYQVPGYGQPGYASAAYDAAAAERQRQEQMRQEQMRQEQMRQQQMQAEMQRKQQEEAQRRLVEQQRQEQLRLKREAEQKAKAEQARIQREQAEKRAAEQRSVLGVRKIIQKLRLATPETFAEIKQELETTLASDLPKCGNSAQVVKDEADKGLEQASKRVELVQEQRKRDQEKKEAEEKKRAETEAVIKEFVEGLTALVEAAEAASEKLKELGAPFEKAEEKKELKDVEGIVEAMEKACKEAKENAKKCTDYIVEKGNALRDALSPAGLPAAALASQVEAKAALAKLLNRMGVLDKSNESHLQVGKTAKEEAVRKASAKTKTAELTKKFNKHDKDKDKFLSQAEVTSFAKAEMGFECKKPDLDKIWKCAVKKGEKGVSMASIYLLKTSVGIAKELARNKVIKEKREAREKIIANLKGKLKSKIQEVEGSAKDLDKDLEKIEQAVAPLLQKVRATPVPTMLKEAEACEKLIKMGLERVEKVKAKVETIPEGMDNKYEQELKEVLDTETKKLQLHMARSSNRLGRATNLTKSYREKASRKTAAGITKVRDFALKLARQHAREKSLSSEELFTKVNTKKNGKIDEAEFLKFFTSIDQELKEEEFPEEEPKEEAEAKEGEAKEGEVKVEKPAEEKPKVEKKPIEQVELTKEGLKSFFTSVLDAGSKTLSKATFLRILQVHYKVVKDTPLTEELAVAGTPVRTVKVGEVLELLEGPSKEDTMKVFRVKVKAHKDGVEGWVSIAGNAGTAFLEEGAQFYKACAKVALTDSAEEKESSTKLKEGEVVEVLEWPTTAEDTSLRRMKVKARISGKMGWITQVDEEGKVLADPI